MEKDKYALVEIPEDVKDGIQKFSKSNWDRNEALFNGATLEDIYFTTAIAEEVGEVCGVIKKLKRGFNERELLKARNEYKKYNPQAIPESIPGADVLREKWYKDQTQKLALEVADVFIYLNLLAYKNGINLMAAVEEKFNKVTLEMKPNKEHE